MIRALQIDVNAAHPDLPLEEAVFYNGSPGAVLIRGVPRQCGRWNITAVNVTTVWPDESARTVSAVRDANNIWVATIPAPTRGGTVAGGFIIRADGIDGMGNPVTGYTLGIGDVRVLYNTYAPVPEPETLSDTVRYFETPPQNPKPGNIAWVGDSIKLYDGADWRDFTSLADVQTAIAAAAAAAAAADAKADAAQAAVALAAAKADAAQSAADDADAKADAAQAAADDADTKAQAAQAAADDADTKAQAAQAAAAANAAAIAALPSVDFTGQTIAPTLTQNELADIVKTFYIAHGGKISAAKEYPQDGLIAMWDAEENAGWATHAAAPSLWKNLVEDKDHWRLTGYASNYYTFGDDYLLISGTNTRGYNAESAGRLYGRSNNAYESAAVKSIGICLDTSGCVNTARFSAVVFSPAASGSSYDSRSVFAATDKIWLGSGRFYMAAGGLVSAAANIASANSVEMFLNGERQAVLTDAHHQAVYATILGGYSPEAAAGVKIHNLRIYNRALSPGEIELCAGIDAQRFGVNV